MAAVALGLFFIFVLIGIGWRTWLQYRRTHDYGLRIFSRHTGSTERLGVLLLVIGFTLTGAAAMTELAGLVAEIRFLSAFWLKAVGLLVALFGFSVMFAAQLQMRDSWRIGVDQRETTALVVEGLFSWVRNPIFSSMLLVATGLLLMVPNVLSTTGLISSLLGIEIQVRVVEEPYLTRVHGNRYLSYARKVGRFLPGIGRLRQLS
jgi:protein-S-isoprenylcysteine O-methyltransferase Ste14